MYYKKLVCMSLFGLTVIPKMVFGMESIPTFGAIAEHLIVGTDMLTRLMHLISIGIGIGFLVMAGTLYKTHRFNPKIVPLERPIIYVVLGLILIILPFLNTIFGPTGSAKDITRQDAQKKGVQIQDIDTPLKGWGNDYDH